VAFVVEALEREGVEVIFAYPGGASMERATSRCTVYLLRASTSSLAGIEA